MIQLSAILKKYTGSFHPVVEGLEMNSMASFDLSSSNKEISEFIFNDTESFTACIEDLRKKNKVLYLTGGYNELREMYKRSALFNFEKEQLKTADIPSKKNQEPRRLHLGVDIWGTAGTKVYAPLGGMVHSFANNNNYGDYGATIILQHQIDMVTFYTLYGHLRLSDIAVLRKGQFITRGQCFAHFGSPLENGNWPPHLHFQIIEDIERNEGDYPGVCKVSEANKYLKNCPDPDFILDMKRYIGAEPLPIKIV